MLTVVSNADSQAPRVARKRLYAKALELPGDERAELACGLLESLETDDEDERSPSRHAWSDAWAAEVSERLAAMDAGEPGITAAEAIASLRQRD